MRSFEGAWVLGLAAQVPGLAAREEGPELVGEKEAQLAQVLLGVGEQETQLMELLSSQRSRQGVYTGPVQFEVGERQAKLLHDSVEVGERQAKLLHSARFEVETQGRPPWRGPLWRSCWAASRSSPVQCTQGPSC